MQRKRIIKVGVALVSVSIGAYYGKEIRDGYIGALRFGRTAVAVGGIMVDYNRSLYSKTIDLASAEYAKARSEVHLRSAQRLLKLCETNGGAFIKVGQHLGALDYLLPFEYVSTMKVLHSQAPQSSFEDVLNVIKEDLKCEPSTVFQTIEKTPIGTASLAQVHKAELNDGTVVAVKVQHPLVKAYSTIDMKSMEILVNLASWVFPDLKLEWLVKETKINLPCELNFVMEGENSEKTAGLMKHLPWLHIPKVYWDLSTSRVLTMEYCEGFEIGVLGQEKRTEFEPFKKEISQKITKLYSDMIFLHGYVHCDPHPGNLKIELKQGKLLIHLLDHGLYAQLPTEFRENYAKLWMSIIRSNVHEIEEVSEKLGVKELHGIFACMVSGRSWNAILGGIDQRKKTSEEEKEIKNDASKYVAEIIEVLHRVPREMLLVFKTNDLLRGLNSTLGVRDNITSFVTMSRSCANAHYLKEYSQCSTFLSKLHVVMSHYVAHFKITAYELLLWWAAWWAHDSS
ncbi:aarF domain-containing protein kinase 1-like [Daphnia pulicaria]|uniref:aarF domain-containing protein kinase 1-like n=1 Tax=Daphnia pulicaria TaxID=35523 RepID=UPI001EEC6570|nr:aarF domain-containing protein kinase 1-like [Daphnia pulicaria]